MSQKKEMQQDCPNGLVSWSETHYVVVEFFALQMCNAPQRLNKKLFKIQQEQGHAGLYSFAHDITREFEVKNKGREWDGEWLDELLEYIEKELTKKN